MSIGLLATTASIVKLYVISSFGRKGDYTYPLSDFMLCSLLELFLGIIGACLPCLKLQFERCLRWVMGLYSRSRSCSLSRSFTRNNNDMNKSVYTRNRHSERNFWHSVLGDNSLTAVSSEGSGPIIPEVVVLDGLNAEGKWMKSGREGMGGSKGTSSVTIVDDERRKRDLTISGNEGVVLYGLERDGEWKGQAGRELDETTKHVEGRRKRQGVAMGLGPDSETLASFPPPVHRPISQGAVFYGMKNDGMWKGESRGLDEAMMEVVEIIRMTRFDAKNEAYSGQRGEESGEMEERIEMKGVRMG
jgi:hypothetical protein